MKNCVHSEKSTSHRVIASEAKQSANLQEIASVTLLLRNAVWTFRSGLKLK